MENINIKKAIKSRGKTITEVANYLGIGQSSLSLQIQADSLTLVKLKKIAEYLNIPLSELVISERSSASSLVCPHCGKPISIKIE